MLYLFVWIPVTVVLAIAVATFYLLSKVPRPARSPAALAAASILLVGLASAGYMEFTIRKIAREAAEPIKGLILRPIPNTGGDHEYTRNGKEYERRAFKTPFLVGVTGILLASLTGSVVLLRYGGGYAAVWCAATACALGLLLFWVYREFTTWDIFI